MRSVKGRRRLTRRLVAIRENSGAALIELAIVIILLMTMAFAAIEYGLLYAYGMDLKTSTRAGVRIAVATTATPTDDWEILQAILNSRGDIPDNRIENVVIYKSTTPEGNRPLGGCSADPPISVDGECNVYTYSEFDEPTDQADVTAKEVLYWDPATRTAPEDLGVYIKAKKDAVTGFFGNSFTTSDQAVLRIEPAGTPYVPPAVAPPYGAPPPPPPPPPGGSPGPPGPPPPPPGDGEVG